MSHKGMELWIWLDVLNGVLLFSLFFVCQVNIVWQMFFFIFWIQFKRTLALHILENAVDWKEFMDFLFRHIFIQSVYYYARHSNETKKRKNFTICCNGLRIEKCFLFEFFIGSFIDLENEKYFNRNHIFISHWKLFSVELLL